MIKAIRQVNPMNELAKQDLASREDILRDVVRIAK